MAGFDKVVRAYDLWTTGFRGLSSLVVSSRFSHLVKYKHTRNYSSFGRSPNNNLVDVDKCQVYHFKPRNCVRDFFIVKLVGLGLAAVTCLSNVETIPYSKRTHLVIMPRKFEKMIGESAFKLFKAKHEEKILEATHPTSARVNLIARKVIKALEIGLRDDKVWGNPNFASRWKALSLLGKELDCKPSSSEIGEGDNKGELRAAQYMKYIDWEVIVVNDPTINACSFLGGKIALFTGVCEYFNSDAEIAFLLGHEIAHAVARHSAEELTMIILELFSVEMPMVLDKMLSRKMELEADYIGMLLMASAGYDPRVAARVVGKKEEDKGEGDEDSYWTKIKSKVMSLRSTHPSNKKRAEFLARAQEEAMDLYRASRHRRIKHSSSPLWEYISRPFRGDTYKKDSYITYI